MTMAPTVWLDGHHVDVGSPEHERLQIEGHVPQEPPYETDCRSLKGKKLRDFAAAQGFEVTDKNSDDHVLGLLGYPGFEAEEASEAEVEEPEAEEAPEGSTLEG